MLFLKEAFNEKQLQKLFAGPELVETNEDKVRHCNLRGEFIYLPLLPHSICQSFCF